MKLLETKIDLRDSEGRQSPSNVVEYIKFIGYGYENERKFCGHVSYKDIKYHYVSQASFIYMNGDGMLSLSEEEEESYFEKHTYREIAIVNNELMSVK